MIICPLSEWAEAEHIEISELADNPSQDNKTETLEANNTRDSYIGTKNTHTKKQQSNIAASSFEEKKVESDFIKPECDSVKSSSSSVQKDKNTSNSEQNADEDKNDAEVDYIVNKKWKDQIKDLDSAGIPVNKTLIGLLKSYKFEQVKDAIALFKTRKREQHIPNPAGYFVTALKENWAGRNVTGVDSEIDTASMFRYWYDLAKELGYCSGQEVRDNEQWVCLSGAWEKWSDAVGRGYSLDYLKKILKRNKG